MKRKGERGKGPELGGGFAARRGDGDAEGPPVSMQREGWQPPYNPEGGKSFEEKKRKRGQRRIR